MKSFRQSLDEMSMMNTHQAHSLIIKHTRPGESLATHKPQIAERIRRAGGHKTVHILDHNSIRHESVEEVSKDPIVEEMNLVSHEAEAGNAGKGHDQLLAKLHKEGWKVKGLGHPKPGLESTIIHHPTHGTHQLNTHLVRNGTVKHTVTKV